MSCLNRLPRRQSKILFKNKIKIKKRWILLRKILKPSKKKVRLTSIQMKWIAVHLAMDWKDCFYKRSKIRASRQKL